MSAINAGLTPRLWRVVRGLPMTREFCSADILRENPGLAEGKKPVMAIGRSMRLLRNMGGVALVACRREHGATYATAWYRRVADSLSPISTAPDESMPCRDGMRQVRFGDDWRPFREPQSERPWRGYESGLARIF